MGALLVESAERGDSAAAQRALDLLPETPSFRILRARARLAQVPPDLGRARTELLAARRGGGTSSEIAGRLGILAQALGNDAEALEELERHAASGSTLPDAWLALGRVRERAGDAIGAAAAQRRATELAPGSPEAWRDLASSLEGSDEAASLAALDRALELDPAHRGARLARMRLGRDEDQAELDAAVLELLVGAGEKEEALGAAAATALAGLEPGVAIWPLRVAEAHVRAGELESARAILSTLPAPGLPDGERARAALLALQVGLAERALALTEAPGAKHAQGARFRARGGAQLALGLNSEAIPTLKRAVELTPWRSDVRVALAEAMLRARYAEDEVIEQLETARVLAPDDPRGRSRLGTLHRSRGRRAEALTVLEEAARLEPDSVAVHDQLGLLLHELGRTTDAVQHLERAAALAPRLRRERYNLACVLLVAGRPADAVPHFEAACDETLPGPAPPANAEALLVEARKRSVRALAAAQSP